MYEEKVVQLLTSIDASLRTLVGRSAARAAQQPATDADLDGKYGNPVVKKMPRDWTGPSFDNRPMSECPPELLDMIAERFDYFARQADEKGEVANNGKPASQYKRQDAARARGWAKRMRSGRTPTPRMDRPVASSAPPPPEIDPAFRSEWPTTPQPELEADDIKW